MRKPTKMVVKVLDQLMNDDDRWIADRAKLLRDQIKYSMERILAKVPGASVTEKAAACGVSRQAYYAWMRGISRPNIIQAKAMAKVTGFTVEQIRGRQEYAPPRINPEAPVKRRRKRAPPVEQPSG